MDQNIWIAFGLTMIAGLSTGFGALVACTVKKRNTAFLSGGLGFSAGVMIYVSFVELFPEAQEGLNAAFGEPLGKWVAPAAFFGGMLFIAIIDKLIPEERNPHEPVSERELHEYSEGEWQKTKKEADTKNKLHRVGLKTALSIAIHNFPEGIATFAAALKDPAIGVTIALAVAIHNIPEGMGVAVPIYYATGDRRKAFRYAFSSGLAEPAGALVAYFLLSSFLNDTVLSGIFAAVAGIMVFISIDELLPTAEEYGEHHIAIYGIILGMIFMAVS